jgi:hypothetical protein
MHKMKNSILFFLIILLSVTGCRSYSSEKKTSSANESIDERGYFIDGINGSDTNPGTIKKPLKTVAEVNLRIQKKAANICFAGGQTFTGRLLLNGIIGSDGSPVKIKSWGNGRAVMNGGNDEAIKIENSRNIWILDLDLRGNGRNHGNKTNGLSILQSSGCKVENISTSGFQTSGVAMYNCKHSVIRKVIASENGFCGINILGSARNLSHNILIQDCKSENNPGDPTNLDNHSGNGILVGVSDSVTIDHCTATNNGWDMPRKGNGPVGIWAWESDHITIQYCISYRNKTSKNAKDGGGFDLDGGVKNSVIQYCLSYENQGAGYGLFQYAGASFWSGNTVRYCVSINDGQTTEGSGSIFIWNGSDDVNQLTNCMIYNNVIYNSGAPLISYDNASGHKNFMFFNNIFVGSEEPITGVFTGSSFLGNDWWNARGVIKFMKFASLAEWAERNGQEMVKNHLAGMQLDPEFEGPMVTDITDPYKLENLIGFKLKAESPLKNRGLDVKSIFGIEGPAKDFYGNNVPSGVNIEPGIYKMK